MRPETPSWAFSSRESLRAPGDEKIDAPILPAISLPLKRRRYNDDVHLGPYQEAGLRLDGRTRKGIRELLDRCRGRMRHVRCALKERFPPAIETPLPSDTLDAIEFIRPADSDRVLEIWGVQ